MEVVAEASNGREALEQFRKHRPDITLMDLQMPVMSALTPSARFALNSRKHASSF
jgi:YesN/AraC family two-component response regulator